MFLLIRKALISLSDCVYVFTFHNVSINTVHPADSSVHRTALHSTMFLLIQLGFTHMVQTLSTLHSTMFLLIPAGRCTQVQIRSFTFHNVSINTAETFRNFMYVLTLHSTMFLLIRAESRFHKLCCTFTFHNVSINTRAL